MRVSAVLIALGLAFSPACAPAAPPTNAPKVSIASLAELPRPLPLPYDERADATAELDAAFARAKASGKRVLVDFGGNWCGDCRVLAGVMELPEVAAFLRAHYEVVEVDVGRLDKNTDLVARLGVEKLKGVPTVVIADSTGRPLNVTNSADLTNARAMSPQGIADWLARFAD